MIFARLTMLEIIKNFIARRDAKVEYRDALRKCLSDWRVDESHERHLEQLASQYGLNKSELRRLHQEAVASFFEQVANDGALSEEEKSALKSVIHIMDPETSTFDYTKETFSQHYWLALIDKGIFPAFEKRDLGGVLQKKEVLHWTTTATLKKWTREITGAASFGGGLGGSVRLTPGTRYRMGSVKSIPIVQEVLANDDTGRLWLSDRRLGFIGRRKKFAIALSKAESLDVFHDGIAIRVAGRKAPQILGMANAEFSAVVLSALLRPESVGTVFGRSEGTLQDAAQSDGNVVD